MPIIVPTSGGKTFSELQTEFYERGPDYLQDDAAGQTRAKTWLNSAYQDICGRYAWPFLRLVVTDTAPMVLTDLKEVLSVFDVTRKWSLWGLEVAEELETIGVDVTQTGVPTHWYLEGDALNVYPVAADTLEVRYIGVPDEMTADDDRPVIPPRFQDLIIDGGLVWAWKDNDAYQKSGSLAGQYEQGIQQMYQALMFRQGANPLVQRQYFAEGC